MVFVILVMWRRVFRRFATKEITKTGCDRLPRKWQSQIKSRLIQVYIIIITEKFKCYIIRIMLYFFFELTLIDLTVHLYSRRISKILFNLFNNWVSQSKFSIMSSLIAIKLQNANMCFHIEHAFQLFQHCYFKNDLEMTWVHDLARPLEIPRLQPRTALLYHGS